MDDSTGPSQTKVTPNNPSYRGYGHSGSADDAIGIYAVASNVFLKGIRQFLIVKNIVHDIGLRVGLGHSGLSCLDDGLRPSRGSPQICKDHSNKKDRKDSGKREYNAKKTCTDVGMQDHEYVS